MHANSFGARLLEMRETAGLTLRQLALAIEVDHTYLSHLESGRRVPPDELLERIAAFFREDIDVPGFKRERFRRVCFPQFSGIPS